MKIVCVCVCVCVSVCVCLCVRACVHVKNSIEKMIFTFITLLNIFSLNSAIYFCTTPYYFMQLTFTYHLYY